MANEARGEVDLTLAGKAYTLRPTFNCLELIEADMGCSIHNLITRIRTDQDFKLSEVFVVIARGLAAADVEIEGGDDALREMIYEQGIFEVQAVAADFLSRAMLGPKNLELLSAAMQGSETDGLSGSSTAASPSGSMDGPLKLSGEQPPPTSGDAATPA